MRLSSLLTRHIVSSEPNVTSITSKVALGSADAGFAYITDARAAGDRVRTIRLPTWARLGVSRSSAHNYLTARACPRCGRPLTSPTAAVCSECTRHEPSIARAWTRAEVIDAIREWTHERGRLPTYRDWTPSRAQPGRWEAESPR